MKYRATVVIMDDVPDSAGDIITDNVIIPNRRVPVSMNFTRDVIGLASVTKEGNTLVAEIEIDKIPPDLVEKLTGVVGGSILSRNGISIDSWKLKEIGLTDAPADKRLPKLKRIE